MKNKSLFRLAITVLISSPLLAADKSKATPPAVGEPIELKFNAVKGGKVDISTLKVRVVRESPDGPQTRHLLTGVR